MAHKYGVHCCFPNSGCAEEVIQSLLDAGLTVGPGLVARRGRFIDLASDLGTRYHDIIDRAQRRIVRRQSRWKRSQRELDNPSRWTSADWDKCKLAWKSRCAYCGRRAKRLTRDHFIPLTDPKCPGTVPWNIVPACVSCNSSKRNRDPHDWFSSHRTGIVKGSPQPPYIDARLICRRHKRETCANCAEKWRASIDVNWDHEQWRVAYESFFVTIRGIVMGALWRMRALGTPDGEARIGFSRKRLAVILAYLDGLKVMA